MRKFLFIWAIPMMLGAMLGHYIVAPAIDYHIAMIAKETCGNGSAAK